MDASPYLVSMRNICCAALVVGGLGPSAPRLSGFRPGSWKSSFGQECRGIAERCVSWKLPVRNKLQNAPRQLFRLFIPKRTSSTFITWSALALHGGVPTAMDHHSLGCLPAEKFPTCGSGLQGTGATTLTKRENSRKWSDQIRIIILGTKPGSGAGEPAIGLFASRKCDTI